MVRKGSGDAARSRQAGLRREKAVKTRAANARRPREAASTVASEGGPPRTGRQRREGMERQARATERSAMADQADRSARAAQTVDRKPRYRRKRAARRGRSTAIPGEAPWSPKPPSGDRPPDRAARGSKPREGGEWKTSGWSTARQTVRRMQQSGRGPPHGDPPPAHRSASDGSPRGEWLDRKAPARRSKTWQNKPGAAPHAAIPPQSAAAASQRAAAGERGPSPGERKFAPRPRAAVVVHREAARRRIPIETDVHPRWDASSASYFPRADLILAPDRRPLRASSGIRGRAPRRDGVRAVLSARQPCSRLTPPAVC